MKDVRIFNLEIRKTSEKVCEFTLSENGIGNISREVAYDDNIIVCLENWQNAYLHYYQSNRGKVAGSGSGQQQPETLEENLKGKEQKLLSNFYAWLKSGILEDIRTKITKSSISARIYLRCENIFDKLPWETSRLGVSEDDQTDIQIIRTGNIEGGFSNNRPCKGKKRILAIAGYDKKISLEKDFTILKSLRKVAEVIYCGKWSENQPEYNSIISIGEIKRLLEDADGWDMLFFAGHSRENKMLEGIFPIDDKNNVTLVDIKDSLKCAMKKGLQFILFNSCSGLDWAKGLTKMGFAQVLVMREQIDDKAAHKFFEEFANRLRQGDNVYAALELTRNQLRNIQADYPSVYLVPSLYGNPQAELFRLTSSNWKGKLQQYIPSKLGISVVLLAIISSLFPPLQKSAVDIEQLFASIVTPPSESKIVLVHIDKESLESAEKERKTQKKQFTRKPIDREYLASLIEKLTASGAKSIAVDYWLDKPGTVKFTSDVVLDKTIKNVIKAKVKMLFASGVETEQKTIIKTNTSISSLNLTARGNIQFDEYLYGDMFPHHVESWHRENKQIVPFAYFIAMMQEQFSDLNIDNWIEKTIENSQIILPFSFEPWITLSIDYSRTPNTVYDRISAKDLLKEGIEASRLTDKVVLIAPGGYKEAGISLKEQDYYPLPRSIALWSSMNGNDLGEKYFANNRQFTGGEVHAYIADALLKNNVIVRVSDLLMILISIVGSQCTVIYYGRKVSNIQGILIRSSAIYLFFCLTIYGIANIAFPVLLPCLTTALVYILPTYRNKNHA
jgi:CHASE2 domain-containing sensor protein